MLSHLPTAALPSNLFPIPHLLEQNTDESDSLETMSDEVDLETVLPSLSLGPEERKRIFELRLRRLVLVFTRSRLIIINRFLAGRSRNFKWGSCYT